MRRCIDIRNDELNEIEQLKLAGLRRLLLRRRHVFDDENEPAEWRPGTHIVGRDEEYDPRYDRWAAEDNMWFTFG